MLWCNYCGADIFGTEVSCKANNCNIAELLASMGIRPSIIPGHYWESLDQLDSILNALGSLNQPVIVWGWGI